MNFNPKTVIRRNVAHLEDNRIVTQTQGIFTGNETNWLAFIEVKTRSSEAWTRPAAAVDARKRRLLSQTALHYQRRIKNPKVKIRFDIVEVLLAGSTVREVRHLPNTFPMSHPYRYG